jgi:mono/diheme cytochrome c family protein
LIGFVRAPLLLAVLLSVGACRERRKLELPNPDEEPTRQQVAQSDTERGERLFAQYGCPACHTIHGAPLAGPPLDRLLGRPRRLVGGAEIVADEDYLRESIYAPSAKVVEGFAATMPRYDRQLSDEEIDAIVDYLVLLGT